MCDIDTYDKQHHPKVPDGASSGGGRPLSSTSLIHSLASFGHKLHFINQWIQCLDSNYSTRASIYNDKMQELFETIPLALP